MSGSHRPLSNQFDCPTLTPSLSDTIRPLAPIRFALGGGGGGGGERASTLCSGAVFYIRYSAPDEMISDRVET